MAKILACTTIGLAALLSACGGGVAGGNANSTVPESGVTTSASGGTDILDACKTLDKSVVEQSLGGKVLTTELSAVHDGKDGQDRYSQCAYSFGGTNMIVFGTGESSDDIATQSERLRSQFKMGSDTPTEDVAGVGKAALWNAGLHSLYVFPGDGRFLSFSMGGMGGADQKAAAVALAHKAGF